MELLQEHVAHNEKIWSVAWHPYYPLFASSSSDTSVIVYQYNPKEDFHIKVLVALNHSSEQRTIRRVKFSPCGNYMATCGFDGVTIIWKVPPMDRLMQCDSWVEITRLEGHENEVKDVSFSSLYSINTAGFLQPVINPLITLNSQEPIPFFYYIATCGRDKTVWFWQFTVGNGESEAECIGVGQSHQQDVKCVTWHPHYPICLSTGADESIRYWSDIDNTTLLNESGDFKQIPYSSSGEWQVIHEILQAHSNIIWQLAFSGNGSHFVTCSEDGYLKLWDFFRRSCISQLFLSARPLYSLSIYQNIIAVGAGDNFIHLIELTDGSLAISQTIKKSIGDVNTVACHPFHPYLLSGGDDCTLRLFK